jgi:hypothetical protein
MQAVRIKADLRPCGVYTFEVKTNQELNKDQIRELQLQAGYHPGGYGGPFDITKTRDGYTFCCWNTCD